MIQAAILAVSVWGPGLELWAGSQAILAGAEPYQPRPSPPPPPAILAATERRRTGPVVRLALAAAFDAASACGHVPGALHAVFASGNGDGPVVGGILEALAAAPAGERVVSPTQFHNSVHNAAAGYWSIGTSSRQPATCLGCHDSTWAAGLLAAMAEMDAGGGPVLLCCYDHPLPAPLDVLRPTLAPFAAALVLGPPAPEQTLLGVSYEQHQAEYDWPLDPALLALARGNPAAQSLPLLVALARRQPGCHAVPYLDGRLDISVQF